MLYKPSHAFTVAAFLILAISSSLWYRKDAIIRRVSFSQESSACPNQPPPSIVGDSATGGAPLVHSNIAVASYFGPHFDVYLTVVWTIQRVIGDGHVQVYGPAPFGYNFQNVSDELGLYHGHVKDPEDLIQDVLSHPEGGGIDLIILGTCEVDMGGYNDELLAAWDARDEDNKFKLVCIVHHVGDTRWQAYIGPWARRDAIRLLPISEHVARAFRENFESLSVSSDVIERTQGFEHILIDVHVQILDLPRLPQLPEPRVLTNAVIQGSFAADRRAYSQIFQELIEHLHEDPEAWGYLPLGDGPSFVHNDTNPVDPPFKLHLVGSGAMVLPPELENVVIFHVGLNYDEYYNVMAGMDVCVPAFGPNDDYYLLQASSTVAMCMQVDVPILAMRRTRDAYTYINDDRVTVTYPAVMTEIDAIKALRTGSAAQFLESDPSHSGRKMGSSAAVRRAVEQMMQKGWIRSKKGFQDTKREVWAANDVVVRKLLSDL